MGFKMSTLKYMIDEKLKILDNLKPGQFNNGRFYLAQGVLLLGILMCIYTGWILLVPTLGVYMWLVYGCINWESHKPIKKWR